MNRMLRNSLSNFCHYYKIQSHQIILTWMEEANRLMQRTLKSIQSQRWVMVEHAHCIGQALSHLNRRLWYGMVMKATGRKMQRWILTKKVTAKRVNSVLLVDAGVDRCTVHIILFKCQHTCYVILPVSKNSFSCIHAKTKKQMWKSAWNNWCRTWGLVEVLKTA